MDYILTSEEDLIKFFQDLPDDKERDFELSVTGLAKKSKTDDLEVKLLAILKQDLGVKIKYAAFYTLAIMHRYNKDFAKMRQLISSYADEFQGMATYSHLCLLHHLCSGQPLTYKEIEAAYDNRINLKNNAGVVHLFADIIATFYEETSEIRMKRNHIEQAIEAIDSAIKSDKTYAKYHATKSRLLFLDGHLDEALYEIDMAIAKELPKNSNYMINMYAYQNHKIKIVTETGKRDIAEKTNVMISEMAKEQLAIKCEIDNINESLIKNIEFIGFFAGVIALVIGSLQMSANQPPGDAIKLIIVLFGSLLSVFAGFGIVLHGFNKKKTLPNLVVMFFGLIVVGGVLLLF